MHSLEIIHQERKKLLTLMQNSRYCKIDFLQWKLKRYNQQRAPTPFIDLHIIYIQGYSRKWQIQLVRLELQRSDHEHTPKWRKTKVFQSVILNPLLFQHHTLLVVVQFHKRCLKFHKILVIYTNPIVALFKSAVLAWMVNNNRSHPILEAITKAL